MATLATLGCSSVLRFRKPEAAISSSNQDLLTEFLIRTPPKQPLSSPPKPRLSDPNSSLPTLQKLLQATLLNYSPFP
ncbi:hypothetical protein GQ457_02G020300 [Hibiscus cannabinus]